MSMLNTQPSSDIRDVHDGGDIGRSTLEDAENVELVDRNGDGRCGGAGTQM